MLSRMRSTSRLTKDLCRYKNLSQLRHPTAGLGALSASTSNSSHLISHSLSSSNSSQSATEISTLNQVSTDSLPEKEDLVINSDETFASLLRHSAFMQMGNPVGKVNVNIEAIFKCVNYIVASRWMKMRYCYDCLFFLI